MSRDNARSYSLSLLLDIGPETNKCYFDHGDFKSITLSRNGRTQFMQLMLCKTSV